MRYKWKIIKHKQSASWQHVCQLKASAICSWLKKLWLFKNATAYTWNWYRLSGGWKSLIELFLFSTFYFTIDQCLWTIKINHFYSFSFYSLITSFRKGENWCISIMIEVLLFVPCCTREPRQIQWRFGFSRILFLIFSTNNPILHFYSSFKNE
jgi:hypothetical protein